MGERGGRISDAAGPAPGAVRSGHLGPHFRFILLNRTPLPSGERVAT